VAVDGRDTLVVLDGGGPMAERVEAIAAAVEVGGAQVVTFAERDLGEPCRSSRSPQWSSASRSTSPRPAARTRTGSATTRTRARAGVRVDRVLSVFAGIDAPPVDVKDMLLYSLNIHQA
jgi:hypothetical protein